MNRFKAIGSALLFVPALALVSTQARAEFKCDTPTIRFDRMACEKAKEGPRRCVSTSSAFGSIDSLQFSDYVNEAQARAWAQSESEPSPGEESTRSSSRGLPEKYGA